MFILANLTKKYDAKGILSNDNMTLTEIVKEVTYVHDLTEALKMFEGEDISFSITRKQEIIPEPKNEE